MNTIEKIRQSNLIERIYREPTTAEVVEHERFMNLASVTVEELAAFVSVYQPNAVLRDRPRLDVRIGAHLPMPGGPLVRSTLANMLDSCNKGLHDPFMAHVVYEMLHPFTDGNGRSGRMLWYWMMARTGKWSVADDLGFLHCFYYQTLMHMQEDDDIYREPKP